MKTLRCRMAVKLPSLKKRKKESNRDLGESYIDLIRSFVICLPGSLNVAPHEYYLVGGCKEMYRANPHASRVLREAIISVSEMQHVLMNAVYGCEFVETMLNVYCNQYQVSSCALKRREIFSNSAFVLTG